MFPKNGKVEEHLSHRTIRVEKKSMKMHNNLFRKTLINDDYIQHISFGLNSLQEEKTIMR